MRAKGQKILYCHMNDQLVGQLRMDKGKLYFQYSESWLHYKNRRPISLSLPLTEIEFGGTEVLSYFENLLPDNPGIRQRIVDELGADSTRPFDLLTAVGRDCIGALTLTSSAEPQPVPESQVELVDDEEITQIINRTRTGRTLGMQDDNDFRISLAGAQDKTALTLTEKGWGKPFGRTPTTHILKPHIESGGDFLNLSTSVENEWFCLRFMNYLDMNVASAEIAQYGNNRVLVVERFDRRSSGNKIYRLPQEDFCQALGVVSGSKYEDKGGPGAKQVMQLLSSSIHATKDRHDFMMSQFVFWLLAAIDGHAKNFSLFLQPEGHYLTPFYDVMSAHSFMGQENIRPKKIKMAMAINSTNRHYHWYRILPRHWESHAKSLKFSAQSMNAIIEQVLELTPAALDKAVADAGNISDQARIEAEKIAAGTMKTRQNFIDNWRKP